MSGRAVDPARARIVLVGTYAYSDPALPDVPVIANNVADLAKALTDPELGGFDPAHCVVAPPRAGVEQVGDLLVQAAAEAEDLLLFYYSGHGLLGPLRRELYLTLAGTRPDRLAFTALAFDAVRDACLESRARSRVVILDSCFSGRAIGQTLAGDGEAVANQLEVAGSYTLTSAPANRTAVVLPGEEHTAFTERLLRLLSVGSAEAGAMLTLGDIYRHLRSQLGAEGLPLPQQRGTETADLLGLVRNRYVAVAEGVAAERGAALLEQGAPAVMERPERVVVPVRSQAVVMTRERARRLADEAVRAIPGLYAEYSKAYMRCKIVNAVAGVDPETAERLADRNEHIVLAVSDDEARSKALAEIVKGTTGGDLRRAERAALAIPNPQTKAEELAKVVKAMARSDPRRAERLALAISDEKHKARALAGIVRVLADGDPEAAGRLAHEAERAAMAIEGLDHRAKALAEIVDGLAGCDPQRAQRLTEEARLTALAVPGKYYSSRALRDVVQGVAGSDPERAEGIAWTISDKFTRTSALADIAKAVAGSDPRRAEQLAEAVWKNGGDKELRALCLAEIAQVLAGSDPEAAERVAGMAERAAMAIMRSQNRGLVLVRLVRMLADSQPQIVTRLAILAQSGAPEIYRASDIAGALADSDPQQAERAALAMTNLQNKSVALVKIVKVVAGSDSRHAEQLALAIPDEMHKAHALAETARAVERSDPQRAELLIDQAERAALKAATTWQKSRALAVIAAAVVGSDPERAAVLADQAERAALEADSGPLQVDALVTILRMLSREEAGLASL
jgi:Caspase domain